MANIIIADDRSEVHSMRANLLLYQIGRVVKIAGLPYMFDCMHAKVPIGNWMFFYAKRMAAHTHTRTRTHTHTHSAHKGFSLTAGTKPLRSCVYIIVASLDLWR